MDVPDSSVDCVIRDRPFLNDQLVQGPPSNSTSNDRRFTVFPRLPAELRLKIWGAAIEELQYRIFYVKLRPARRPTVMMMAPDSSEAEDQLRRIEYAPQIFPAGFEAIERRQRLAWSAVYPSLLHVSRESRNAYLSVFRIAMSFGTGRDDARGLDVYLSPDRDVLDLNAPILHGRMPIDESLRLRAGMVVNFLCSLRKADPKGLGIGRLSMGAQVFSTSSNEIEITADDLLDQITPSLADRSVIKEGGAAAFAEVLGNLVSFFYVIKLGHTGRCNPAGGTRTDVKAHFSLSMPAAPGQQHQHLAVCTGCVSHRYVPSTPDVATFTWFDRDPRPHVAVDTEQLLTYQCPHQSSRAWTELEQRFGVERAADSPFRVYFAAGEELSSSPFDRATARRHLRDEWASWRRWSRTLQEQEDCDPYVTKMGNLMSTEQAAAVENEALLAVGLWLWPSEAVSRQSAKKPCDELDHEDGGPSYHDLSGSLPGLLAVHID
ncbi:hypothetical protein MAPG_04472 [Magnaporthiopsis poae ATCC 64411]|uniref:2EXR domain-containing protein n=1 Tax=Magnaporthiopsis poae (strain ATCC 64411 / 73-15) TaxID=644358 RepID=A0A0C4DWU1_MAGP6|nr:hypothetical protein MAPG_04472 [Magnaporthiopsis poae ATCC 64411]